MQVLAGNVWFPDLSRDKTTLVEKLPQNTGAATSLCPHSTGKSGVVQAVQTAMLQRPQVSDWDY